MQIRYINSLPSTSHNIGVTSPTGDFQLGNISVHQFVLEKSSTVMVEGHRKIVSMLVMTICGHGNI